MVNVYKATMYARDGVQGSLTYFPPLGESTRFTD